MPPHLFSSQEPVEAFRLWMIPPASALLSLQMSSLQIFTQMSIYLLVAMGAPSGWVWSSPRLEGGTTYFSGDTGPWPRMRSAPGPSLPTHCKVMGPERPQGPSAPSPAWSPPRLVCFNARDDYQSTSISTCVVLCCFYVFWGKVVNNRHILESDSPRESLRLPWERSPCWPQSQWQDSPGSGHLGFKVIFPLKTNSIHFLMTRIFYLEDTCL